MSNAVVIEFPAVDFIVVVGVNLLKEVLKIFLDHLSVEKLGPLELVSHPSLQLAPLEDVVPVEIVPVEDVFNKRTAVRVHQNIFQIYNFHSVLEVNPNSHSINITPFSFFSFTRTFYLKLLPSPFTPLFLQPTNHSTPS